MWCVPRIDDDYRRCMNDVLEVYARALDEKLPVICIDEKLVELRADARAGYRIKASLHRDYEYIRHGTANIFMMTEPKAGKHWAKVTATRKREDFAHFLRDLAARYRSAVTIHLIMDNLNTHFEKSLLDTFGPTKGARLWARFTVHYTPKHGSWLNQAEIALSMMARACLGKRRFADATALKSEITAYWTRMTRARQTIDWKWTRSDATAWLKTVVTKH
jgi:transposase